MRSGREDLAHLLLLCLLFASLLAAAWAKNTPSLKLRHETQTQSSFCLKLLEQKCNSGSLVFHAGQRRWGRQDPAEVLAVDVRFRSRTEEGFTLGQAIPRRQSQPGLVPRGVSQQRWVSKAGDFRARDKKRCWRAGQRYLRDLMTARRALDLGPADPRLVQSDTGYYTGVACRE